MKQLADVLVQVVVRQLTARRAGKEKARAPLIQANGLETLEQMNDTRKTNEVHTLRKLRHHNEEQ